MFHIIVLIGNLDANIMEKVATEAKIEVEIAVAKRADVAEEQHKSAEPAAPGGEETKSKQDLGFLVLETMGNERQASCIKSVDRSVGARRTRTQYTVPPSAYG